MNIRRAEPKIIYEGVDISRDIAPFLTYLAYTDNGNGRADDLQITLADREGKWRGPWMPRHGDRIKAEIFLHNWYYEGLNRSLPCGTFEVDSIGFSGPPDIVNIEAASYPGNSAVKNESRTKAWENVTLRQVASRIASAAGLNMMYETYEYSYERLDQSEETDLSFLSRICEQEGINLKIANNTLVLFDDRKYESMAPVRTLIRGVSDIKSYSFDHSLIGVAYAASEVSYFDSVNSKTIRGSFRIPVAAGPTLKINERVESEAEAIRKARNALRQQNRNAQQARLTVVGDYALAQGLTVQLEGFGEFDDKYFINSAQHVISGKGYETTIDLRKVLSY